MRETANYKQGASKMAKKGKAYYDKKKKDLKGKLDSVLSNALVSKDEMDKLSAHYRIGGLYHYSFYNSITIAVQGGEIAQSFNGWKKLKRTVKKGEHANIHIFRPFFKKVKDKDTGKEEQKLVGFGLAPVFDVSQTEGEDLQYDHNSEGVTDHTYEEMKATIQEKFEYEITERVTGSARGFTDGKKITISSMSNNSDKIKTLIHELAHCRMEHISSKKASGSKEVEAEGASYLVMSYVGIDYELSPAYIGNWQKGADKIDKKLIIKVADEMIKTLFVNKEKEAKAA